MARHKSNSKVSRVTKPKKAIRKIPKTATQITKQRRFDRTNKTRAVSHVTEAEFVQRHLYCITKQEIERQMAHDPNLNDRIRLNPRAYKAVCNHPEDGYCGMSITIETLQKVNDRLAHKVPMPINQEESNDLEVDGASNSYEPVRLNTLSPTSDTAPKKFTLKIGGRSIGS